MGGEALTPERHMLEVVCVVTEGGVCVCVCVRGEGGRAGAKKGLPFVCAVCTPAA